MQDLKFTKAEKELFESFKQGGWKAILIPEIKKKMHTIYLEKDTTEKLKAMAEEAGVSYKDLATSILQKFANS